MAGIGKALIILGLLMFVGSVAWWYLFFEQFHGDEVKQASDCFYYFAEHCAPSSLERIIEDSGIPAYTPYALWASVVAFGLGVVFLAVPPLRR